MASVAGKRREGAAWSATSYAAILYSRGGAFPSEYGSYLAKSRDSRRPASGRIVAAASGRSEHGRTSTSNQQRRPSVSNVVLGLCGEWKRPAT